MPATADRFYLRIDEDGDLIDTENEPLMVEVAMPVVGRYPEQEAAAHVTAYQSLYKRIRLGNLDPENMKQLHFDTITHPDGRVFATARVGAPVNEVKPLSDAERMFGRID